MGTLGNHWASRYKADLHTRRRRAPVVVIKGQGECLHTLSLTAENAGAVYRCCCLKTPRSSADVRFICLSWWLRSGRGVEGVIESTIQVTEGALKIQLLPGLLVAQKL